MSGAWNGPALGLDALRRGLTTASCLYLALPYAIFFVGWLRWWVAVPAVALLAAPCWGLIRCAKERSETGGPGGSDPAVYWRQVVLLLGVALVLAMVSGMGGYGFQDPDYLKHNAVLRHLIGSPWPATLASDVGEFPLVYYIAWYLPAACVGKIAGWGAANHLLFAWGTLGLVLAMLWFCVLARECSWIVVAVFVTFSGLDLAGATLWKGLKLFADVDRNALLPSLGEVVLDALRFWDWNTDWWVGRRTWNYPSNLSQLLWAPQHALGGWIATGMILAAYDDEGDRLRRRTFFFAALSSLWTPFVTIGLAPILAMDALPVDRFANRRPVAWTAWPNLCGLGLVGLIALYYAARIGPLPFSDDPSAQFRFLGNRYWTGAAFLVRVLIFFVFEVGVMAALAWWVRPPRSPRGRALLLGVLGFLLVLPFFRYGFYNDLVMRASMPCLMVLVIFVARSLRHREGALLKRIVLAAALVVAATTPLRELQRHVSGIAQRGALLAIPEIDRVPTVWELSCRTRHRRTQHDYFFRQYIGSPESFFFRHFARESTDRVSNDTGGRTAGTAGGS